MLPPAPRLVPAVVLCGHGRAISRPSADEQGAGSKVAEQCIPKPPARMSRDGAPFYLEQHPSPADGHYVWAYHVRIENHGGARPCSCAAATGRSPTAQGRQQEVRGPGVVGEEPVLAPGGSFEYTRSCPLPTPSGFMVGDYEMETRTRREFPGAGSGLFARYPPARPTNSIDPGPNRPGAGEQARTPAPFSCLEERDDAQESHVSNECSRKSATASRCACDARRTRRRLGGCVSEHSLLTWNRASSL